MSYLSINCPQTRDNHWTGHARTWRKSLKALPTEGGFLSRPQTLCLRGFWTWTMHHFGCKKHGRAVRNISRNKSGRLWAALKRRLKCGPKLSRRALAEYVVREARKRFLI
jgi:hypothetical protein